MRHLRKSTTFVGMTSVKTKLRSLELLAPARDAKIAIEAIKHGADAVYMGGPGFGARAAAGNSLDDIRRVVDFAHLFNVRVYVTVNTIIYDIELLQVEKMIASLYQIGVDALIVQDLGVLRLDIPPIALHASTQCDTRNAEKARFLQDIGFSQIVLARELSLKEISDVCSAVTVPIEVFIHGALCVSYSGDCHASYMAKGRSANRGECAQICRLPYDLTDADGRRIIEGKHLLSLRDLNQSKHLAEIVEAGASSFKIEGRLKDASYVKNTVAYYRRTIDRIIESNPERYRRASTGETDVRFNPALEKSFNRGFTNYFLIDKNLRSIASIDTPKSQGEIVGKTTSMRGNAIKAYLYSPLANGDGLGYFNESREFCGFRLNRIDGDTLYPANPVSIPRGTTLYRNKDKRFDDTLAADTASRIIDIDMNLRRIPSGIAIDITDTRGASATVRLDVSLDAAKTPQQQARQRILAKLGGTIYRLRTLTDTLGDVFIAASTIADLRRSAIQALERSHRASYSFDYRQPEQAEVKYPDSELSYHANVANHLAKELYSQHGVDTISPALEISNENKADNHIVMTTRYCLRRELGCCLKSNHGNDLPRTLYLKSDNIRFRLDFDCRQCRMKVIFAH